CSRIVRWSAFRPHGSPLFPSTTLFRSLAHRIAVTYPRRKSSRSVSVGSIVSILSIVCVCVCVVLWRIGAVGNKNVPLCNLGRILRPTGQNNDVAVTLSERTHGVGNAIRGEKCANVPVQPDALVCMERDDIP